MRAGRIRNTRGTRAAGVGDSDLKGWFLVVWCETTLCLRTLRESKGDFSTCPIGFGRDRIHSGNSKELRGVLNRTISTNNTKLIVCFIYGVELIFIHVETH